MCTSGRCQITLATGPSIDDIAVDSRAVYWTDSSDGTVLSIPTSGGAVTTLASGQDTPLLIAVNSSNLYWSANDNIIRLTLGGGSAPVALASAPHLRGLAVDATSLYWTRTDGNQIAVSRVPANGGPVTTLVSDLGGANGIAVDAANAYWAATTLLGQSMVMSVPIGGGNPVTVAQAMGAPYDIAALPLPVAQGQVAHSVYWTGQQPGGLFTAPAAGGPEATLATNADVSRLAVDATTVYWTTTSGAVMSVPAAGGTPVTLAALAGMAGTAIAVDATSVYWVAEPSAPSQAPPTSSLMKLTPK